MNFRKLFTISLVAVLPATAYGGIFDGVYDLNAEKCLRKASDSRMIVSGRTIEFWESSCELTNPVTVNGMPNAMLYQALCAGEGSTWNYRLMLTKQDPNISGKALGFISNNYVGLYSSCPAGTTIYGN